MMLDPEGSGGLLPPPVPEEDPAATVAATDANIATTNLDINRANPKGGEI